MGEGPWTIFCGKTECSHEYENNCTSGFTAIINPYSCLSHVLVIFFDIIIFLICLFVVIYKSSSNKVVVLPHCQRCFSLPISSAIFNGGLGLAYVGCGVWTIQKKLRSEQGVIPLHGWLVELLQGFTWLLLGVTVSLRRQQCPHIMAVKHCTVLAFLLAGFLCIPSLSEAIMDRVVSVKTVLDIFSFPGAILMLFCAFQSKKYADIAPATKFDSLHAPLTCEADNNMDDNATPLAKAGFLSRMTFWWLNPLLKKGKEKILKDRDIPKLRKVDRAETCYLMFMEQLSKRKDKGTMNPPILSTLFFWQWRAILISGFFALIKVLTLSTGPLLLKAFIEVAEGKEAFKYEGYVLTVGLFLAKCLESLSERQWYFQTRPIGLQVRSLLSAAIYQKQLRLSNAAKTIHSPGEITNYVTGDAYRIGEFPYWFHQIWATGLQICLAFVMIYHSVGLASIAAVLVILLTVFGNYPVAKFQHKHLIKLMEAQDRRLRAITEALINMKVLKLYAWETHFKNVIEVVRREESNYLSAVLSERGYNLCCFGYPQS